MAIHTPSDSKEAKLDLSNSKLVLDGTETERNAWKTQIKKKVEFLEQDRKDRESLYNVRRDFYVGDQSRYTNIVGKKSTEKEGHANSVINYAGKTAVKIAYSLANNPPNITFPVDPNYKPDDDNYVQEEVRTQATEDFVDEVFRRNHFWKRGFRRAVFNQVIAGDFAIKTYPQNVGTVDSPDWEIKIVAHEKMENLLVGWRGDDTREFDFVVTDEMRSIQSIEDEWGIKVPRSLASTGSKEEDGGTTSTHQNDVSQWGVKNAGGNVRTMLKKSRNKIPSIKVREYDDQNVYIIMIGGEMVEFVKKNNIDFPRMKFWTLGENIPCPGTSWSISDIDYLIDPQIEMNEGSNDERDLIRVGTGQKFVAYNMSDFDPKSVKPGSGGVIFVDSPDGSARFEPLNTNVNTYPADTYLQRIKKHIHDLGVPEVTYGAAGGNSGRSKAIDYQSFIDLTIFKRDTWELVLYEICEKIQMLGAFYFPDHEFFKDVESGEYKYRPPEFDWEDILPVTQSDKIVNVLNKFQMGLPFTQVYKELGYRDVEAMISEMKKEAKDPTLMEFRSKFLQLTPGLVSAQQQAQSQGQPANPGGQNPASAAQPASPILTNNQNDGSSMPVSGPGTSAVSSPGGVLSQQQQNQAAKGQ